jgi:predicted secreted protein
MIQLIICTLLTIITIPVWAGDAATLNFIGFSNTGKYLAFQQYGVTDGKGAAYATLYFVDVADNRYQEKPIETSEDSKSGEPGGESAQETVRQLNLDQAKAQLKSLNIVPSNTGIQVISHLTYDTDINPHVVHFTLEPRIGILPPKPEATDTKTVATDAKAVTTDTQTTAEAKTETVTTAGIEPKTEIIYEVSLEEHQAKSEADCGGTPAEVAGFTLTLQRSSDTKPKILQYDSKIPKSRGCPLSYHIQDVYTYKDKYLAVFIHVYTTGFEGKNMRYIVVTGALD